MPEWVGKKIGASARCLKASQRLKLESCTTGSSREERLNSKPNKSFLKKPTMTEQATGVQDLKSLVFTVLYILLVCQAAVDINLLHTGITVMKVRCTVTSHSHTSEMSWRNSSGCGRGSSSWDSVSRARSAAAATAWFALNNLATVAALRSPSSVLRIVAQDEFHGPLRALPPLRPRTATAALRPAATIRAAAAFATARWSPFMATHHEHAIETNAASKRWSEISDMK